MTGLGVIVVVVSVVVEGAVVVLFLCLKNNPLFISTQKMAINKMTRKNFMLASINMLLKLWTNQNQKSIKNEYLKFKVKIREL